MTKPSYEDFVKNFTLNDVESRFVGSFHTGLNVCEEICDRYADTDAIALRYERVNGISDTLIRKSVFAYPKHFVGHAKRSNSTGCFLSGFWIAASLTATLHSRL